MKKFNYLCGVAMLLLCQYGQASIITIGALSSDYDGSTYTITDNLNNLEWLRWDVLADLNYAETLTAIGTGGAFDGWQIAHNAEAQMFASALFDGVTPTCNTSDSTSSQLCGITGMDVLSLVGHIPDSIGNLSSFAWFLDDTGTGEAGRFHANDNVGQGAFNSFQSLIHPTFTIDHTDQYSATGGALDTAPPNFRHIIPWLLFCESDCGLPSLPAPVGEQLPWYNSDGTSHLDVNAPEPTTLALLSLGLFGLGFNRRKRLH